ncbi:MAG: four helix bundle protein [Patescibacteria group bacterium]
MKNEKPQEKDKKDLRYRSYVFSLDIISLLEKLPKNYIYEILGKQVLRSATSIGANIVEAQAGSSKKDFVRFYQIALKSCNEIKYWLSIFKIKQKDNLKIEELLNEAIELGNILGASIITMKSKRKL